MSQVDMAFDILRRARSPLHVSEIIDRIQAHFGVSVDRESLVSSPPARRPAQSNRSNINKAAVKQKNLSRSFVQMGKQLRAELDQAGGRDKP